MLQQVSELTNEQKLITKLVESAKQDLAKLEESKAKLEVSKKQRIAMLASDIDSYGLVPTEMICDFIVHKLSKCNLSITRNTVYHALDAKYKNQNRVAAVSKSKVESSLLTSPSLSMPSSEFTANAADYESFDVRDCVIESWDSYPDFIKKQWTSQLIEDKRSLQMQIVELLQGIKPTFTK